MIYSLTSTQLKGTQVQGPRWRTVKVSMFFLCYFLHCRLISGIFSWRETKKKKRTTLWSDGVQISDLRRREQMLSTCVVPILKLGGWHGGALLVTLFIQNSSQNGNHGILQWHVSPYLLHLVGASFVWTVTQKHISNLCKGYLTKKKSDVVLRHMTWTL